MSFPFPVTIDAFVVWLASAGAAGVLVSMLLERFEPFQKLGEKQKHYSVLVLFALLPLVSLALQVALGLYDKPLPATAQEWVKFVLSLLIQGLTAWASSQWAHAKDPQRDKEIMQKQSIIKQMSTKA
jgi:hypothetical protein